MDLTYYEEIKYNFIEETNECNICYELFFENFKCKRCSFYVRPYLLQSFLFYCLTQLSYVQILTINIIYFI